MDFPRREIAERATAAIQRYGGPARACVFFKFTCTQCGARCMFQDANTLWEEGDCHACGLRQPVTHAGFALQIAGRRTPPLAPPWQGNVPDEEP